MNMKRFLSVLLILAMLVCTIPAFAVLATAEGETTAWDGTSYDVSWCDTDTSDSGVEIDGKKYKVTGYTAEEAKTYEISTAEQLAGLAKLVNAYKGDSFANVTVYLTADVDLGGKNWTMIGKNGKDFGDKSNNKTYAFAGSFVGKKADGSNAVISNLTVKDGSTSQVCVGLFGLYRGPLMANLTLKNAVIESGYGRTGSFAGTANETATFRNLISDAQITMKATAVWHWNLAGGIVGATNNKTTGTIFDACVFTGKISSENAQTQAYGGIVGVDEGILLFNDCIVTGDILGFASGVAKSGDPYGIGGILGVARGADKKVVVKMERCYVSSDLTGFQRVGGFLGAAYAQSNTTRTVELTDCQFDGTVISNGGDAKAALAGRMEFAATVKNFLNTGVASCRNDGSIKMGLVYGDAASTFTNCYGTYKIGRAHV